MRYFTFCDKGKFCDMRNKCDINDKFSYENDNSLIFELIKSL